MLKVTSVNYCGQVVEIKKVIDLENCDNVRHANIFGNLVIVSKDTKEGDVGIYFPVECRLSDEFLKKNNLYRHEYKNIDPNCEKKGYFEDNGRIKAVKFRGHVSNGLFISLDSLSFIGKDIKNKLNVGDEFNEINNIKICDKYYVKRREPNVDKGKNNKPIKRESRLVEGQFRLHYDTTQLGKNINRVDPNDVISITGKLHGTSAVVGNLLTKKKLNIIEELLKLLKIDIVDKEYGMVYSSRKVIKNEFFNKSSGTGYYNSDVWLETANKLFPFIQKGITLYYEIVGFTATGEQIQKDYDYGCVDKENKIFIYRITQTNEDGNVTEFSAKQVQDWCKMNGFTAVPEYYYGYAKDLFKDIEINGNWHENFLEKLRDKYLEKDCIICKNKVPDEGIVLRLENSIPEAFKLKSFKFLQKETRDLDKGVVSMEDEESI